MIMLADRVQDARPDQETIGGIDMTVRRNAFGSQVDSFEADLPIPVLGPEPLRAVFIRAPWVESVGADVEVLATVRRGDDDGTIVAVRQGSLMATAFHPELTGDARVHELFVEMVRKQA
jgi:5'-phosphate synthase pdxT subunit